MARLDGLILAGGNDLDPALYGAEPDPRTDRDPAGPDAGEVALLRARDRRRPADAGHLPRHAADVGVRGRQAGAAPGVGGAPRREPGGYVRHEISTVPGTRLAGILGERSEVPSYHHQGVADPGTLTVSAYAFDGGIEGVEDPSARFRLGVLWHPEQGTDPRLFEALLSA